MPEAQRPGPQDALAGLFARLPLRRWPAHRVKRQALNRGIFALIGLRPPAAEHTAAEGKLLQSFAAGRRTIVEIGVAEGASAWEIRSVMDPGGTLYLVDPYPMSRLGPLCPKRLVAHRLVGSVERGRVVWIEQPSQSAWRTWIGGEIDFLFIDGDHDYDAVRADWEGWTAHLSGDGHVALHDASLQAPWTDADSGPVRLAAELRAGERGWRVVEEVDSLMVLARG